MQDLEDHIVTQKKVHYEQESLWNKCELRNNPNLKLLNIWTLNNGELFEHFNGFGFFSLEALLIRIIF